jgi:ABC-type sugar transport system substrate-binding protein
VIQLGDAWAGKPVPHTTPLDVHYITKDNVDKYQPQY